jgi:hypothetical protein
MVTVQDIVIRRFSSLGLIISWTLKNTIEPLPNYVIDIYRSEAPSSSISDYDLVVEDLPITTYSYTDLYTGPRENHNTK